MLSVVAGVMAGGQYLCVRGFVTWGASNFWCSNGGTEGIDRVAHL